MTNVLEHVRDSIFPPTTCTALVVWNQPGTLGSTIGIPKITKFLRDITYIPSCLIGVFIGLLLGDANINTTGKKGNPRVAFKQSIINFPAFNQKGGKSLRHFPFFWMTFWLLSHYCSSLPYLDHTTIKGIKYFSVRLDTRKYPRFHLL